MKHFQNAVLWSISSQNNTIFLNIHNRGGGAVEQFLFLSPDPVKLNRLEDIYIADKMKSPVITKFYTFLSYEWHAEVRTQYKSVVTFSIEMFGLRGTNYLWHLIGLSSYLDVKQRLLYIHVYPLLCMWYYCLKINLKE